MDLSESPVADWSKEPEYNNWFIKFDSIGDVNDAGETYENAEKETEGQGQGDDDDD